MPKDSITRSEYLQVMFGDSNNSISKLQGDINALGSVVYDGSSQSLTSAQMGNISSAVQQSERTIEGESHQSDRNWWQRYLDTAKSAKIDILEGIYNWFDGIGDFLIGTGGEIATAVTGDQSHKENAKNAMAYDWQAQAITLGTFGSDFDILSGDIFSGDYWNDYLKAITNSTYAREKINSALNSSYATDFGEAGQWAREMAVNIGNMAPSILGGAVGGEALSLSLLGAGALGSQFSQEYQKTDNYFGSTASGLASAGVEVASELLFDKIGKALGIGHIIPGVSDSFEYAPDIKTFAKKMVATFFEEGAEEAFSGIMEPIVASLAEGGDSFIDENGRNKYQTLKFWTGFDSDDGSFSLSSFNQSVLGQAFTGGVLGIVLGAPSQAIANVNYESAIGKDLAMGAYWHDELVSKAQELNKAKDKLANLEQGSQAYQRQIEKIGKLGLEVSDAQSKTSKFLEAGKKSATKLQKENFSKMVAKPNEFNGILSKSYDSVDGKNSKISEEKLSKELSSFFDNYIEDMKDPVKYEARSVFNALESKYDKGYRIEFGTLSEGVEAKIDRSAGVITIDTKNAKSISRAIAHEYLGHAIGDLVSLKTIKGILGKIEKSSWYKKHGKDFVKSYMESDAFKTLYEYQKEEMLAREIVNKYIEQAFEGSESQVYDSLTEIFIDDSIINKISQALQKSNGYKALKNNAILKEFVNAVKKVCDSTEKRALVKYIQGKKLSPSEQKRFEENKELFKLAKTAYEGKGEETKPALATATSNSLSEKTALGVLVATDKLVRSLDGKLSSSSAEEISSTAKALKEKFPENWADEKDLDDLDAYIKEVEIAFDHSANLIGKSSNILSKGKSHTAEEVAMANAIEELISSIDTAYKNIKDATKKKRAELNGSIKKYIQPNIKLPSQTIDGVKYSIENNFYEYTEKVIEIAEEADVIEKEVEGVSYDLINRKKANAVSIACENINEFLSGYVFDVSEFNIQDITSEQEKQDIIGRAEYVYTIWERMFDSLSSYSEAINGCDWDGANLEDFDTTSIDDLKEYLDNVNYFIQGEIKNVEALDFSENKIEKVENKADKQTAKETGNAETRSENVSDLREVGKPEGDPTIQEFERLQRIAEVRDFQDNRKSGGNDENTAKLRAEVREVLPKWLALRGLSPVSSRRITLGQYSLYEKIDGPTFKEVFALCRKFAYCGEMVDVHDNDYSGYDCYLSDDGCAGFAVTKDKELISVFSISSKGDFLANIAPFVQKNVEFLSCYRKNNSVKDLVKLYSFAFGFKPVATMDYNMKYDHDNIAVNHAYPDVVIMINKPSLPEGISVRFPKILWGDAQYDKALAFAKSLIEDNNEKQFKSNNINGPIATFTIAMTEKDLRPLLYHEHKNDYKYDTSHLGKPEKKKRGLTKEKAKKRVTDLYNQFIEKHYEEILSESGDNVGYSLFKYVWDDVLFGIFSNYTKRIRSQEGDVKSRTVKRLTNPFWTAFLEKYGTPEEAVYRAILDAKDYKKTKKVPSKVRKVEVNRYTPENAIHDYIKGLKETNGEDIFDNPINSKKVRIDIEKNFADKGFTFGEIHDIGTKVIEYWKNRFEERRKYRAELYRLEIEKQKALKKAEAEKKKAESKSETTSEKATENTTEKTSEKTKSETKKDEKKSETSNTEKADSKEAKKESEKKPLSEQQQKKSAKEKLSERGYDKDFKKAVAEKFGKVTSETMDGLTLVKSGKTAYFKRVESKIVTDKKMTKAQAESFVKFLKKRFGSDIEDVKAVNKGNSYEFTCKVKGTEFKFTNEKPATKAPTKEIKQTSAKANETTVEQTAVTETKAEAKNDIAKQETTTATAVSTAEEKTVKKELPKDRMPSKKKKQQTIEQKTETKAETKPENKAVDTKETKKASKKTETKKTAKTATKVKLTTATAPVTSARVTPKRTTVKLTSKFITVKEAVTILDTLSSAVTNKMLAGTQDRAVVKFVGGENAWFDDFFRRLNGHQSADLVAKEVAESLFNVAIEITDENGNVKTSSFGSMLSTSEKTKITELCKLTYTSAIGKKVRNSYERKLLTYIGSLSMSLSEKSKRVSKTRSLSKAIKEGKTDFRSESSWENGDDIINHAESLILSPLVSIGENESGYSSKGLAEGLDKVLSKYTPENFPSEANFPYDENIRNELQELRDSLGEPKVITRKGGRKDFRYPSLTAEQENKITRIIREVKKVGKDFRHKENAILKPIAKATLNGMNEWHSGRLTKPTAYERASVAGFSVVRRILGNTPLADKMTSELVVAESNERLYIGDKVTQINQKVKELGLKRKLAKKVKLDGDIVLTNDQLVDLYLTLTTEQNFNEANKSGIEVLHKNGKYQVISKSGEAYALLKKVESAMTKEMLEYAQFLKGFLSGSILDDYRKMFTEKYGVEPNEVKDYWSMSRKGDKVSPVEMVNRGTPLFGNEISRRNNNRSLLVRSASNVVATYIGEMARELYTAPIYRDCYRILNTRIEVDLDKSTTRTLNDHITKEGGKTTMKELKYLLDYLDDYVGGRGEGSNGFFDKMMRGYTAKTLSMRIGTPLKQFISLFATTFTTKRALMAFGKNITRAFDSAFNEKYQAMLNKLGALKYRKGGSSSLDFRSNESAVDYVAGKTANFGTALNGVSDRFTMSCGLIASMMVADAEGYKYGTAEYDERVIEVYNEFRIQQIGGGTASKSSMARGHYNKALQLVFTFLQGPSQAMSGSYIDRFRTLRENWGKSKEYFDTKKSDADAKVSDAELELDVKQNELEEKRKEREAIEADVSSTEDAIKIAKEEVEKAEEAVDLATRKLQNKQADRLNIDSEEKDYRRFKTAGGGVGLVVSAFSNLAVYGLLLTLINNLDKVLRGKKDKEDFFEDFGMDLALNTFASWVPIVNTLTNTIISNYDVTMPTNAVIDEFVDLFKTMASIAKSDSPTESANKFMSKVFDLGQTYFGVSITNALNYVYGAHRAFDAETAMKMGDLFYSTSQTKISQALSEYASEGNSEKTKAYIGFEMSEYKAGDVGDALKEELSRLAISGNKVSAKNKKTSYKQGDETVSMSAVQQERFSAVYSTANDVLSTAIRTSAYLSLSDSEKSASMSRLYNLYYNLASISVFGSEGDYGSLAEKISLIGIDKGSKYAMYACLVDKSKGKQSAISQINSMSGLTKDEKLVIAWLLGYKCSSVYEVQLNKKLMSLGLTKSQIAML